MKKYSRFFLMIAVSTVFMYIMMYLNTYEFSHVYFSRTRFFMALMMGAGMAFVMLGFMLNMYKNKRVNVAILLTSVVVFFSSLYMVRSQSTVDDVSWMKAMIPHHSIAILTSERANITDPRVRALADQIIEAQEREIEEMKNLIKELE